MTTGYLLLRLLLSDGSYSSILRPANLVWPTLNAVASMLGLFTVVASYEAMLGVAKKWHSHSDGIST